MFKNNSKIKPQVQPLHSPCSQPPTSRGALVTLVVMDTIQSYDHHVHGQLIRNSHDLIPVQVFSVPFLYTDCRVKTVSRKLQISPG